MLRSCFLCAAFAAAALVGTAFADAKSDAAKAKKALQDLGEFVGTWNLTGESKTTGKLVSWKETANLGWKFKGDDAWITVELKDGKYFSTGELRYNVEKKQYLLTIAGADKKPQEFVGEFKRGKLSLKRTDEKSGDVHQLAFNTLSDGIRLSYAYEVQSGGKGLFSGVYKSIGNKDGESLAGAAGSKKPECVVTGGAGTISVSFMGKTYYVCCTGCKEEFDSNPKKYVDAFEKKK
jgi:YHS domain-containing protein